MDYILLLEELLSYRHVQVVTKNNIPEEIKIKKIIDGLLNKYGNELPLYTNLIVVEYNTRSHSHPELTISTQFNGFPIREWQVVLGLLIHENLHWWIRDTRNKESIKKLFLATPIKEPDLRNVIHIIINFNVIEIMTRLVGEKDMKIYLSRDPYDKVNKKILKNYGIVRDVLANNNLIWEKK